jgi:enterochelin esterase-like enzyme
MSNSQLKPTESKQLNEFIENYSKAVTEEEKDKVWESITTPFIEVINNNDINQRATFIYRADPRDVKPINIYLYSAVVPLFSEQSKLLKVPETDIYYLSLVLPSSLRTTYSFLYLTDTQIKDENIPADPVIPMLTGDFQKKHILLSQLYANNKVEIDTHNKQKMVYYMDFDIQDKVFGVESILELSSAPKQPYIPTIEQIKVERDTLKFEKRFTEYFLNFSDTSLKTQKDYLNQGRKYWIYLPKDYDSKQQYPLILFLDGSYFIESIPIPSILERMINQNEIPSSIAVFLDCSSERRQQEYYCDAKFTQFIIKDFIPILREKHSLSITHDASLTTIVGLSASGLAAFYVALTYPNIFGNVITYSASFQDRKQSELKKLIGEYINKQIKTHFIMKAGSFETQPIALQFPDNSKQNLSPNEANKTAYSYLIQHGANATFHEFVGGHNFVCWRGLISEDLKHIYAD